MVFFFPLKHLRQRGVDLSRRRRAYSPRKLCARAFVKTCSLPAVRSGVRKFGKWAVSNTAGGLGPVRGRPCISPDPRWRGRQTSRILAFNVWPRATLPFGSAAKRKGTTPRRAPLKTQRTDLKQEHQFSTTSSLVLHPVARVTGYARQTSCPGPVPTYSTCP